MVADRRALGGARDVRHHVGLNQPEQDADILIRSICRFAAPSTPGRGPDRLVWLCSRAPRLGARLYVVVIRPSR